MPRPCSVCAHLERQTIDQALSAQVCNVRALGKAYGLGKDALYKHRKDHLPMFLGAFTGSDAPPLLGAFSAEYKRLYLEALDQLARAQAGTLIAVDENGGELRTVSNTAVARAISEARKTLDSLVRLAADAAEENERPSGMANGELTARINEQLQRVVSRALNAPDAIDASHPDATSDIVTSAALTAAPGGQGVEAGRASPPQVCLDAAMPFSTAQGISAAAAQVVADDERSRAETPQPQNDTVLTVPNPRYPGSPAATQEERSAAGYPDITITLDDLKSRPELLQQFAERLP